jgi:hypothetical protein
MGLLMNATEFDRWVSANHISSKYRYGKGFWDYVELVQKLSHKFGIDDVRLIGRYVIETPPPEEKLPMPIAALFGKGVAVALRWDFGRMRKWPFEWTMSIQRRSPYRGPTFGLFDSALDLRAEPIAGLESHWVFGPYRENPSKFTCELEDEWDVATLLRLVLHEP